MSEVTNRTRAEWAAAALDQFQALVGTDDGDAVCDLLCDLMHFCSMTAQDFDAELERARGHHDAERLEEETT